MPVYKTVGNAGKSLMVTSLLFCSSELPEIPKENKTSTYSRQVVQNDDPGEMFFFFLCLANIEYFYEYKTGKITWPNC